MFISFMEISNTTKSIHTVISDFAVLSPPVRRDNVRKTNARIIIIISPYPLFLTLLKKPKQILE